MKKLNFETWINKNKKFLVLAGLLLLLAYSPSLLGLGVLNPGFEGAKCYFYGADFRLDGWNGAFTLHKYQDAETLLAQKSHADGAATVTEKYLWTNVATPNDAGIGYSWNKQFLVVGSQFHRAPDLSVHVESNIQLQDINRQGDPLGWNTSDPTAGKRIEYWSKTVVKEETNSTILYHWNLTKESFIVVPAEFWVGFYLVPAQKDADTGSGWREGEYQNIVAWFKLDFSVWDNAYREPWLDNPQTNVFDTPHNGTIIAEDRQYDYRGGFPIAGFIEGWEKAGWTSKGKNAESPQWYETRGTETGAYTIDQLYNLRNVLMAKCSFAPSLVGQFLSLYDAPSSSFAYEAQSSLGDDAVTQKVKTPDSHMQKTMYFPINIQNFGTYVEGDWWNGYKVYYPSAYFRVRMLYGVYGNFTYLWTEELAKSPTVNYPAEPERHGTTVISTTGAGSWFSGITSWFSSPFNQLWIFFVLIVAVVLVVSVLNPGLWSILAINKRKRGG